MDYENTYANQWIELIPHQAALPLSPSLLFSNTDISEIYPKLQDSS